MSVSPSENTPKVSRRDAQNALNDAEKLYKRAKKKLSAESITEIEAGLNALRTALAKDDDSVEAPYRKVQEIVEKRLKFARKSGAREVVESLLIALAVAFVLRTFFVEPFKIPTRSMVPTLLEGDQLFVTKLSYGLRLPLLNRYIVWFSKPERGDVVVFAFPRNEARDYLARTNSRCLSNESLTKDSDYIKRIIGVEGDTIAVDPSVIPYGTKVIMNGHIFTAEDCGGAIKGKRIDVFVNDHDRANQYGVYNAEVYLLK